MVTYGGMSKNPITVSTSSFIFKVTLVALLSFFFLRLLQEVLDYLIDLKCRRCLLFSVDYLIRIALYLIKELYVA